MAQADKDQSFMCEGIKEEETILIYQPRYLFSMFHLGILKTDITESSEVIRRGIKQGRHQ